MGSKPRRAINEALKIAQAQKQLREKDEEKTRRFEQLLSEHYADQEQAVATQILSQKLDGLRAVGEKLKTMA